MTKKESKKYFKWNVWDKSIPPYKQVKSKDNYNFDDLWFQVYVICRTILEASELDPDVFKVFLAVDFGEVHDGHTYHMLEIQKRGIDEQGNETLKRCFSVSLCSCLYLTGKAGRTNQPNCNPAVFVSCDASYLENDFRAYLFDKFDKLVSDWDIYVFFTSTCPQAWRYPNAMMENMGARCKKVVENVYGEPITMYRDKITRKLNKLDNYG